MKRPGLLTTLLLVTGIPAILWLLVAFLVLPSDFIIPLYAALTEIVLLLAFSAVMLVAVSMKVKRDVKRVRDFRIAKCAICDVPLQEATIRQFRIVQSPHYQNAHSEFWRWNRKWRKPWIVAWSMLGIYIVWVTVYGFSNGNPLLVVLLLLLVIPLGLLLGQLSKRKVSQFRKEWQSARARVDGDSNL